MILERKTVLRTFFTATSTLLVAACSTLPGGEGSGNSEEAALLPLKGKTAIHQWRIDGVNLFVCSRDKKGFYWRFINTSGKLTNEKAEPIAELLPRSRLVTKSGTHIELRSPTLIERRGSTNLPDVLFEAQTYTNEPAYKGVLYITRRAAEGGIPADGCSAGQAGQQLRVRYQARMTLWR